MSADSKIKHLEMIQAVINRMASNSFMFKGWAVTIIAGLSAFAAKDANKKLLLIALFATLLFWAVDAFYLSLERCYRELYRQVTSKKPSAIDFSMELSKGSRKGQWVKAVWSPIMLIFYGSATLMILASALLIARG